MTWYTSIAGNGSQGFVPMGDWCGRVRPSYALPVAGLIALFGASVGAGPVNPESVVACFTGGIGMSMVQGVVGGLAQVPHPVVPLRQLPLPQLASTRELSPLFATSMPVAPIRPMRIKSRRVNPALISS